jgi:hypothetical protein
MGVTMTYDDVLEPVAAIPQAKNIAYGSAYNLAPGLNPSPHCDTGDVADAPKR